MADLNKQLADARTRIAELYESLRREEAARKKLDAELQKLLAKKEPSNLTPDQQQLLRLGTYLEQAYAKAGTLEIWRWTDEDEGDLVRLLLRDANGQLRQRTCASLLDALSFAAEDEKWCPECQAMRPVASFKQHNGRADGRYWRCKRHKD